MNNEKLNALKNFTDSIDNGVTLNHIRLTALEKVLEINFPSIFEQYQTDLYHLLQDFGKQHPNFLPSPNVEK